MLSGSAAGAYRYDGHFKRVKSTVNGKTLYNVFDASGTLIHIDNVTDHQQTDLVGRVARITNNVVTYLHPDHLGSAQAGTNASGAIAWREQYTPFGEALLRPPANDDQAGYTGHIQDKATGLTYMQARYYDAALGRFLSVDPVDPVGSSGYDLNLYAYVGNDPVNKTDPTGEIGIIGFVIGAAIETAVQVGTNMTSGQDFGEAFGNVDVGDVLIAGAVSAVIPGVGNLIKTGATSAKVVANSVRATKTLSQQSARTANRAAKIEQRVAAHAEKMKGAGREVAEAAGVATVHQIVKQTAQVATPPITPAAPGPNTSTSGAPAPPPPPPCVRNAATAGDCR